MSTTRQTAINSRLANLGADVLSSVRKPLHAERLRIRLPLSKGKTQLSVTVTAGSSGRKDDAQDFIGQLALLTQRTPLNQIRLDPLKALEPTRKKLTSLEAQRIMGVLDELKLKCEIVVALPQIIKDLPRYEELLGPEICSMLLQHSQFLEAFTLLEKQYNELTGNQNLFIASTGSANTVTIYEDLIAVRNRLRGNSLEKTELSMSSRSPSIVGGTLSKQLREPPVLSTGSSVRNSLVPSPTGTAGTDTPPEQVAARLEATIIQLNRKKIELDFVIRNILRAFRDKQDVMLTVLLGVGGEKSREGTFFVQCLSDLKDMIFERLLILPIEQNDKMQFLAQVAAQERNNQAIIAKLEEELAQTTQDKDNDMKFKNKTIQTLQENLQALEKATEDDIRRAKTESEKHRQSDNRASQARKYTLSLELKELNHELSSGTNENRDAEQILRKKKWKVESEVENWIQKFDAEMTEKQTEYEEIDAVYQEEKKQLVELEKRFTILETEYSEIMKAREDKKARMEEETRLLEKQTRAAVLIQALWRAFKVRRALKLKDKLKGKKGKKGKKSKKGKQGKKSKNINLKK